MSIAWDAGSAAHLLRRTGFGPQPEEIQKAVKKGFEKTLAGLFKPDKASDKWPGPKEFDVSHLQVWWLERMVKTRAPLVEKLTLFFHNHFATAMAKVGVAPWMHAQNRTLRRHCLGRFRDLLHAVAKDAAMIVWLDTDGNTKQDPNENFARELMELFTTGVLDRSGQPNYSEADVEEGARAFTGWSAKWPSGKFQFNEWDHDFGEKTFRGVTGPLGGEEVLDILADDPATARRLAMKLFSFFAGEVALDDPVLDPLEQAYFEHDTSIRAMLDVLFRMDAFYAPAARRARVKSPMEFLAGALRQLGARLSRKKDWFRWYFHDLVGTLGQSIFDPPSVFGWKEGTHWVSSNGLLSRLRAGEEIADFRKSEPPPVIFEPKKLLPKKKDWPDLGAAEVVAAVLDRLGLEPDGVAAASRAILEQYAAAGPDGAPEPFVLDGATVDKKVRGLVALVLASPEYQLT